MVSTLRMLPEFDQDWKWVEERFGEKIVIHTLPRNQVPRGVASSYVLFSQNREEAYMGAKTIVMKPVIYMADDLTPKQQKIAILWMLFHFRQIDRYAALDSKKKNNLITQIQFSLQNSAIEEGVGRKLVSML